MCKSIDAKRILVYVSGSATGVFILVAMATGMFTLI